MAIIDPKAHYLCSFVKDGIRFHIGGFEGGHWRYTREASQVRPITGLLTRQFIQDHGGFQFTVQQIASLVRLEHSGALLRVMRFQTWTTAVSDYGFLTHHDGQKVRLRIGAKEHDFRTWDAALRFLDRHIARSRRGG